MNALAGSNLRPIVGTRLAQGVLDEVCALIYSPRFADVEGSLELLHQINSAHLLMLAQTRVIDEDSARALARELVSIRREGVESVPMDVRREDVYFNFESHLIARVGERVGGKLHTARSRNDMMAASERMVARDGLLRLIGAALGLVEAMLGQATRHAGTVMPGYTHMRPAQPMTYGFYLHALACAFLRDVERLLAAYRRTNRCPMGAGAFAGVTFPVDREMTASLLGFDGVMENTLDAIASRDFSLEILAALHVFALTWSRAAQDLYVWGTEEFGFLDFPDSIASTSSIMPQKKNPVVLEYLKGRAGHVMAALFAASAAVKGSGFSHAGDSNRESLTGFGRCLAECLECIELLRLVFEHAAPATQALRARAADDFCCVTDVADLLVRESDLSFRQAHHVVGRVVRDAIDRGIAARGITVEMVARAGWEVLGKPLEVGEEALRAALDPDACVSARQHGGPDPRSTTAAIATSLGTARRLGGERDALIAALAAAQAERERRLSGLAQA